MTCALTLALAGAVPAYAQVRYPTDYLPGRMGIPQPEPLVTVNVQRRSLARVLHELFKQTPYSYKLLADSGAAAFILNVKDVPVTRALAVLFEQDRRPDPLVFLFTPQPANRGEYVIEREYIELGERNGEKRLNLSNARLTKVLPMLFEAMKVKGRIEADVPALPVTVQLLPDTWEQALPAILLTAAEVEPALTFSMDRDTVVVHLQKLPARSSTVTTGPNARRVTFTAVEKPLRDVLATLFQGSALKYQVADAVTDSVITYSAKDDTELQALHAILQRAATAGQHVTYRETADGLSIEPGPLAGSLGQIRAQPVKRVSFSLGSRSIRDVAKAVEEQFATTVLVAPNVPDIRITLRTQGTTLDQTLKAIVKAGSVSLPNLTYRQMGQTWVIELGTGTQ